MLGISGPSEAGGALGGDHIEREALVIQQIAAVEVLREFERHPTELDQDGPVHDVAVDHLPTDASPGLLELDRAVVRIQIIVSAAKLPGHHCMDPARRLLFFDRREGERLLLPLIPRAEVPIGMLEQDPLSRAQILPWLVLGTVGFRVEGWVPH